MQDFSFFVQYASEKWINHICLHHSRLFSFQLSMTENAVGENGAVQFVLLSPTHTSYTAVREGGEFSKHALSAELCSPLLSKLRTGKTAWSHFILSHQKENILLKLLEINRFSWRFFPSV